MKNANAENVTPRAVVLYSGGLDSQLAVEVLLRAGVQVVALQHHSVFYPAKEGAPEPRCELVERDISERMIELVRNPQYGYGKNANPCLDCKQMMYGLAREEAERQEAQFIATGEVLGQRPMSQRLEAFARMEQGAGVEGLVVRPLCARLLPPTIPEKRGLYRREDMLNIQGRGRKPQMALAERWGITDYPSPAGGCKLTDPAFAERVFTLQKLGHLAVEPLRAVRYGRIFPLGEHSFVLVGRDREDNEGLLAAVPDDARLLELADKPGPLAAVIGPADEQQMDRARELVVEYSRYDLPLDAVAEYTPGERRGMDWKKKS
jgi:hypothetical protein